MEIKLKSKVIPCKYCKRGRIKIHNSNAIGKTVVADKCVYCNGKGFIRLDDSNINKPKDIKREYGFDFLFEEIGENV